MSSVMRNLRAPIKDKKSFHVWYQYLSQWIVTMSVLYIFNIDTLKASQPVKRQAVILQSIDVQG